MAISAAMKKLSKASTGAALMSLMLSLLVAGEARAVSFNFTRIADDSPGSSSFFPAINDSGTVAFLRLSNTADPSLRNDSILISSGGTLTNIFTAQASAFGPPDLTPPDINNSGTVAFLFSNRVFTSNGTTVTQIASTNNSIAHFFGVPGINNNGTVAFEGAGLSAPGGAVFTNTNGVTSTILNDSRVRLFGGNVPINDRGTVAFLGKFLDNISILTISGGQITLAATNAGFPALNNSDTLAFFDYSQGIPSVVTSRDGVKTTIATTGLFRNFSGNSPAINDKGTVAFLAETSTEDRGIFTGPDPVTNKVIATGDSLFGSIVQNVDIGNHGLNNLDQIVFTAYFVNGTSGIYVATPEIATPETVSVPESKLGAFSILGFGMFLGYRVLLQRKKVNLHSKHSW
jgi:hypothetical protein